MFRFTIRELLLVTVIVGMGLAWWAHVRRLEHEARKLQSDLPYQADYVSQFASCFKELGCEIPDDSDLPACHDEGSGKGIAAPKVRPRR